MKINGLVMHIVDHCNLNCDLCSNFSNMAKERFIDLDWYEKQLTQVTKICKTIKRFYIMGGEPLLHPKLLEFMNITRKILPNAQLDLVTNGILIKKWGILFWRTLHRNNIRLMVSCYPNVELDLEYFKTMAKQYKVTLWLRDCSNWSIVFNPKGNSDAGKAFRICFAKHCYVLYDGKLYLCPRPAFVHMYNQASNENIEVSINDYINIFLPDATNRLMALSVKSTWGITDKWAITILDKINNIDIVVHFIKILVNYGFLGKSPQKQHLDFCKNCVDKRVWFKWNQAVKK